MGNFQYTTTNTATTTDGYSLQVTNPGVQANSKTIFDQVVGTGPVVINLAPLLANLTNPSVVWIVADGGGFLFSYDANPVSVKAMTMAAFQYAASPSGVVVLSVTAQGAAQRLRVFAAGL